MVSEKMKKLIKNNSVIREMFEEGKKLRKIYGDENVFDFSLGNPSIPAPKEVNEAIIKIIQNEDSLKIHGYMSNSGFEDVREAIANSINEKFKTDFSFKNIIMTVGAASGLNIVFKSILNPNDEVIVFAPYFSEYNNYIENYNGIVKIVSPNFDTFEPNLSELENKITSKTKAILINTPNNPTGVVYSEKIIKELVDILKRKQKEFSTDIYLISDEPYRELVYDDITVPYISNYYDNTLIVYSYSKSLSIPGERIGYVVVPNKLKNCDEMIEAITISNRIIGCVNAPALMQKVIPYCLNSKVEIELYKKNRDLLYKILTDLGFECVKPQGAFYIFMKSPIQDEKEFCKLAKKYNILLVPCSSFACPGYVRIAYCVSYEMICNSQKAFEELRNELQNI